MRRFKDLSPEGCFCQLGSEPWLFCRSVCMCVASGRREGEGVNDWATNWETFFFIWVLKSMWNILLIRVYLEADSGFWISIFIVTEMIWTALQGECLNSVHVCCKYGKWLHFLQHKIRISSGQMNRSLL